MICSAGPVLPVGLCCVVHLVSRKPLTCSQVIRSVKSDQSDQMRSESQIADWRLQVAVAGFRLQSQRMV